jgi:cytochrome c oxidase assembly factor CtaG
MLVSSLVVVAALYALGLFRLWRNAGIGSGISTRQALAFAAGWVALAVALSEPMDEWSDHWLVAHMIQHELLMIVAAPLLALAAPLVALMWAMPPRARQKTAHAVRRRISGLWRLLASPATAFILYALALWVWHLPVLYDYALEHEAAHALEHLCFFGTATLFWWSIAHGQHGRAGYGAAVVYLFATAAHGGVLGALLTFAPRVWYPPYLANHTEALTPLQDQQLAGLLMWVPASLSFVAGALFFFAEWLRQSDRQSRFPSSTTWTVTRTR